MVAHTKLLGFVSQFGVEGRDLPVRALDVRGLAIQRHLAEIHEAERLPSPATQAFAGILR
jgi:hypothetical protein